MSVTLFSRKALKVADLKEILVKASAPAPGRVNKQDLINKILANPAAVKVYEELYLAPKPTSNTTFTPTSPPKNAPPPSNNDDLVCFSPCFSFPSTNPVAQLAPPEEYVSTRPSHCATPSKAPSAPASSTKTSPLPANGTKADKPVVVDEELEKRKARAARFGIPLVEPKQPFQRQARKVSEEKQAGPLLDDADKLKKRAERFGASNSPGQLARSGSKRAAPEEVDAEELERRRKRAERFAMPANVSLLFDHL
ncbi:hypothetical protein M404DRAFT_164325 [Pisolithus tinctorius Marx 270]|uniref:THO1-MOS11 C-terminal domain-containing protein n=1 Tax=Pisolithus tinctorius Marx 270 TaxID=870435 RepID=A0A0C3N4M3_PISTI|nr:hypothetical protein M404DRAFT_164325 [Pisolithus tinctorius Marx 270]